MDWTLIAVPVGTLLGAGLAVYGGWLAVRQRERADIRAEWRHRLEIALAELSRDDDTIQRHIGRELLESLTTDEFLAVADRELTERFLAYEIRFSVHEGSRRPDDPLLLDEPGPNRDNEDDGVTGGDDDAT